MKKSKSILKLILAIVILFSITLNSIFSYAQSESEIETKLEQQNQVILDALKDSKAPSSEDEFDKIMDNMVQSMDNSDRSLNLEKVKMNLLNGIFNIAIKLRRYIIPFYMFIIVSNVILIAFLGSKSLQKRRAYIIGSISISIFFVILMNIPILMIYFQNNSMADVLTINSTNNTIYRLIYFLRDNSLPLCVILFVYGVLNNQLGKNDVAKKITGKYFKNTALVIFIVLQMLPIVINFII